MTRGVHHTTRTCRLSHCKRCGDVPLLHTCRKFGSCCTGKLCGRSAGSCSTGRDEGDVRRLRYTPTLLRRKRSPPKEASGRLTPWIDTPPLSHTPSGRRVCSATQSWRSARHFPFQTPRQLPVGCRPSRPRRLFG